MIASAIHGNPDKEELERVRQQNAAVQGAEMTAQQKVTIEEMDTMKSQQSSLIKEQMTVQMMQEREQYVAKMRQSGASPEKIANAIRAQEEEWGKRVRDAQSTSAQAIDQQKSQFMQKAAQEEVARSYNHYAAKEDFDPFRAKQYARADAAVRLRKLGDPESVRLARQLSEMNTLEMQAERDARLKREGLKAQTEASEASTQNQNRAYLNQLTIPELEAEMELASEQGRPTAAYEGLIAKKREEQELAREAADLKRRDIRLREKKELRLATQLNTTEVGYLKDMNKLYDESSKALNETKLAKQQLDRAVEAGRSSGKALSVQEQMKSYTGMQDADISVAQKTLASRAMKRAFSLKQAGAMSDAEFDAYMTAVPPADASYEQWNEFLRLDAEVASRGMAYAAFHSDYLGGVGMSDQGYVGITDEGLPRGFEGMNSAWRANEADAYSRALDPYSRESWGSAQDVVTGPASTTGDLSDDELINSYGGAGGGRNNPKPRPQAAPATNADHRREYRRGRNRRPGD
jgi:hypothetical protein